MTIQISTGDRVDTVYRNKTVSTVIITVGGRQFVHDAKDAVDAMHVAVQAARVLGVRLGIEG